MSNYERYSADCVEEALLDTPIVFVMGARQSGKTTLIKSLLDKEWQYFNLDDQTQLFAAKADPVGFIKNLDAEKIAKETFSENEIKNLAKKLPGNGINHVSQNFQLFK